MPPITTTTMAQTQYRAYHIKKRTGIDNLNIQTHSIPTPARRQVLIRVHAVSLNYRDVAVATGKYPVPFEGEGELIPCSDAAGEVVAVGDEVKEWKPGDRVCSIFNQGWQGGELKDYRQNALGGSIHGVLAEYVVLDANGLVRIPEHLSYEQASTLPCAGLTAWHALHYSHKPVGPSDWVLTLGTGGVSIFAVQFARACGARVIITSSSDDKIKSAVAIGATHGINYKKHPQWSEEVQKLTNGEGASHVIEIGGSGTYDQSISSAAVNGMIHQIGFVAAEGKPDNIARSILWKCLTLRGAIVGSREMFLNMNAMISAHKIQPVVDKVFEFDDAVNAYKYLEKQQHVGKVVIRVAKG